MLRSMYSGIAGMKGFQTKLDVVGNNIANVNTSGYKKGRTTFQDMMSQTLSGAQGPVAGQRGGINPSQVGLGSNTGSVDNVHTQGNRQTTNRPLDLALEGDGMFVLADLNGGNTVGDSEKSFTRSGNFYLDNAGYLVNSQGLYLVGQGGLQPDPDGESFTASAGEGLTRLMIPATAQSFSIQDNGRITFVENGETRDAGQIRVANFSNPGGLQKTGSNNFQETENAGLQNNDGLYSIPQEGGTASVISGALEMSNVDLAEEFTEMITAQRGFQANTRIITTSDEILQELVNLKR